MAVAPIYTLDDKPVTLLELHARFPAYGRAMIRDGLREGHITTATLLQYLSARSHRADNRRTRNGKESPRIYFGKREGGQ